MAHFLWSESCALRPAHPVPTEVAVTHLYSLPKCDKSHGSEGTGHCLAHSLVVQMGKQAQKGRGLAQAHTARPWGSSPRVLGHSPTLLHCRDPEEILKETCVLPD